LVYIGVIVALLIVSATRDGLWKVKDWDYVKETEGSFIDRSLWWTAVPTFFFSGFALYMRRCYDDILDLEPYLGLYKGPTRGERSVLVNYRSTFPPITVFKAWKNGHWISGFSVALTTFFSIILIPLSSHLLETKLYQHRTEGIALQKDNLNLGRLNENADFSRAFEITSALGVYGGGGNLFSQWMNNDYAFPSFMPGDGVVWDYNTTIEIPAVPGYYSRLTNCSFIDEDDYEVTDVTGGNSTQRTLRLTASQDGCEMEHDFEVEGSKYNMYFPTGVSDCVSSRNNITTSRILFLLAWPNTGEREKLALATQLAICSPVFGVDVGTLKVGVLERIAVKEFDRTPCQYTSTTNCEGPDGSRSDFRAVVKAIVKQSATQALANSRTNTFGNLILNKFDVTRRNTSTPLSVAWPSDLDELREDMIASMQSVYATLFLTATSTMALDAAGWPLDFRNTTVQVVNDIEKLFAVDWACIFILVVLGGSLALAVLGCARSAEMRDWDVDAPSNVIQTIGLIAGSEEILSMAMDVKEMTNQDGERTFEETATTRWNCDRALFMVEANGRERLLRVHPSCT